MMAPDSLGGRRGLGPEVAAVLVAAFVWGSVFFDRFGPLYIIDQITGDLGVSAAAGGVLPFAIGTGFAAAALLAIVLANRLPGNRRTLVIGTACAGGFPYCRRSPTCGLALRWREAPPPWPRVSWPRPSRAWSTQRRQPGTLAATSALCSQRTG